MRTGTGTKLSVELFTPEKLVFKDQVDFIAAPSSAGEIGILPGHAPLLTRLGVGELRLKKGTETQYLAITGGFLEVQSGSRVSVFAETAEFVQEIDVERAKQAVEQAKRKLSSSSDLTGEELAQTEAAMSRALLRLNLVHNRWRKSPPGSAPH